MISAINSAQAGVAQYKVQDVKKQSFLSLPKIDETQFDKSKQVSFKRGSEIGNAVLRVLGGCTAICATFGTVFACIARLINPASVSDLGLLAGPITLIAGVILLCVGGIRPHMPERS